MKLLPWIPPEPELERAHDVRRLRQCGFCKHWGLDLPIWKADEKQHAHGYCVMKNRGLDALKAMPATELAKVTVDEMVAMGLTKKFMKIWDEAKARDAKPFFVIMSIQQGRPVYLDAISKLGTKLGLHVWTATLREALRFPTKGAAIRTQKKLPAVQSLLFELSPTQLII